MPETSPSPRPTDYGGRLGYGIFHVTLRLLGVWPAYGLLLLILPYYLILRPSARRSIAPYLRHRFPGDGPLRRFARTARHFFHFGRVLIDQAAMGIIGREHFRVEFPGIEDLRERVNRDRGFILLASHVGSWQSAMAHIGDVGIPVHLQFKLDPRDTGRHFFDFSGAGGEYHFVSPDSFLGGTVELVQALREGHIVALMGDRAGEAKTARVEFLGEPVEFPLLPHQLAVRGGADLIVLLTARTGRMVHHIGHFVITEGLDLSGAPRQESTEILLRRYVDLLEEHLKNWPHMWFNFHDTWERHR